ncbi:auxin response factor [Striga asiatica]|uniref:Auxin-responsive protein n=1 Tax=Striga asiatica TaxID=4170 RepID=A0A5A7RGG3_STRAF|nr:auxin response factor [Striga asiatica]
MENRVPFIQQQQSANFSGSEVKDALYEELWKACAGPLVDVPKIGERVYYFPQGHMEKLEASTNEELNQRIPMFNLPPKILCRVFNIQLLAEQDTDEVYAQITLMPEADQTEPRSLDNCPDELPRPAVSSFCKVLTASDTSTHGGFSVLRKHANECLPPLDMNQPTPTQELVAKDLHGTAWHFKHIFREAVNQEFGVGMRFKMRFEGDDSPERRFSGTIVGVEDISQHWKNSKWRTLKVQWDEPASIPRPERVSPWEIEPFVATVPTTIQPAIVKHKRLRPNIEIPLPDTMTSTASPSRNPSHDQLNHAFEAPRTNNTVNLLAKQQLDGGWNSPLGINASQNTNADEKEESENALGWQKSDSVASCRLFGFDLKSSSVTAICENSRIKHVDIINDVSEAYVPSSMSSGDSEQKSGVSKEVRDPKLDQLQVLAKEIQSRQSNSSRSRTKVQMQGVAVGRAVDLSTLRGYDDLIIELENMFEIKGELRPRYKWEIVFTDDEGDTMLVGDDPWPEFCNMVRRIYICCSQDVKKMKGGKLPECED